MDYAKESLKMHYELKGKIEVTSRAAVDSKEALSLAYTPGVAEPCLEIQKDINKSYDRGTGTWRYRTGGWHAGYGRKMCTVQRVRRRGCNPSLRQIT